MKMRKRASLIIIPLLVTALLLAGGNYLYKSRQSKFDAPRKDAPTVQFRVSKENTLIAVTGNLHYYGFVKDEDVLKYALEQTKDSTPGKGGVIKVGNNTIDTEAVYAISQTMSAWEIARILLNEGTPSVSDCDHGCPSTNPFNPELLPGGDVAPTLQERMRAKYNWVKTYEDCVKSIGHDGGQLTSEENFIQTGRPRKCIAPDGRVFTQGQEGWTEDIGG